MEINTLGEFLQFYRIKYGFRQEKVCSGICSIATLSRIENGSKEVDSLVAESLLGRLGKEVLQFEIILNDYDYELWSSRQEIQKMIADGSYQKAKDKIIKYRDKMPKGESVHEQYCLCQEAKVRFCEEAQKEELRQIWWTALRLTKPELEKDVAEDLLYNPTETELIINLLHADFPQWREKDKKKELEKLFRYVEKIYSGTQKERLGSQILIELIEIEQSSGNYMAVINYVDKAVSFISRGRGIDHVAELHFTKAKMLELLYHDKNEWKEQEQVCKEESMMAYYVFDIMEQIEEKEQVQQFCKDKLKWHIIE